jgi:hypothetical protein
VELDGVLPFVGGRAARVLELTAGDGSKLVVQLAPEDAVDVVGLAREFWSRGE